MQVASIGINVRNTKTEKFADWIVQGKKYYETRATNSLHCYVGKRIGIIRTGEGKAMLIGYATVGHPELVECKEQFRNLEPLHLVGKDSKFDIQDGGFKWLYPMMDVEQLQEEVPVTSLGIIARKI